MIDIESKSERDGIISDLAPDLTPLLDVMFMLIIFLVLTTNTIEQVFDVKLPEDKQNVTEGLTEQDLIKITIFDEGNIWAIDDEKFSDFEEFQQLIVKVHSEKPEHDIIIYSDKNSTIDRLMKLLTFLRSENIETADIVME